MANISAVELSRQDGDNASRELFERLLKDEEEHVDFLEAQVHQMNEIGYERFLSQQIGEGGEFRFVVLNCEEKGAQAGALFAYRYKDLYA